MTLSPLGDSAVVLTLGGVVDSAMVARVRSLAAAIEHRRLRGVVDVVPAFASVAVFYDAAHSDSLAKLGADLEAIATEADHAVVSGEPRRVEIPVCYGGEFGPDLEEVAGQHALPVREVIALHSGADYLVHAIGFVPGFPYLGGLPEKLATPRRATPRPRVPAGTVGIGGAQTGVYSLATPGGWSLIGRTPLRLFDPGRSEPALLEAGDHVQFRAIHPEEFAQMAAEIYPGGTTPSAGPDGSAGIEVIRPGVFTTVQDAGRVGHRAEGVVLSGAADTFALRVANLLVGNPPGAAGLEFTMIAPELKFHHDTIVALGGAEVTGLPSWQPLFIKAGTVLNIGQVRRGCRGYLAVAGGMDVPLVLGSRSTYVRAAFGGFNGRPLNPGDVLPLPGLARSLRGRWHIDERILPHYSGAPVIRVVRGAQADEFGPEFFSGTYTVTPQADRMGVRLHGAALARNAPSELLSAAVVPGTIQVPPDGQPIVLLADAQTIGGYPQVAHVIANDLPLMAQVRPGDTVRFQEMTLDEAHEHARVRERALAILQEGLAQKMR